MRAPSSPVAAFAVLLSMTTADLQRATSVGRRSDAERARFHAPYLIEVKDATVEQIEVTTEFRRAVLVVEERARAGDYMFGVRQLEAALRPYHNQVAIRAKLRFHPQNRFTSVPSYEIRVGEARDRLVALRAATREPILSGTDNGASLIGACVELRFDSGILGQSRYPIAVVLEGRTIASTTFDFGSVE